MLTPNGDAALSDALEEGLVLDRIGPVKGLRILDVSCGDGVLATRLAKSGALAMCHSEDRPRQLCKQILYAP